MISASRRTDIPAFFGEWFMRRIAEGYFYQVNPAASRADYFRELSERLGVNRVI